MASYTRGRNGSWSVRFRIFDPVEQRSIHKRISGFERKRDAESAMRCFIANQPKSGRDLTLGNMAVLYQKHIADRYRQSSQIDLEMIFRRHILPYFGNMPLKSINRRCVLDWQNQLSAAGLSYNYKCKIRCCLHSLFKYAQRYYDLGRNPVAEVEPFRNADTRREMRYWSESEYESFIAVSDNPIYRALFALLYWTGLRKGEALALCWADVDFEQRTITVNKSLTRKFWRAPFQHYTITAPKNDSSYRKVSIPQVLIDDLTILKNGSSLDHFVFGGYRPIPEQTLSNRLRTYCRRAGVPVIRIHDLRHSHASLLINKGVNILAVARRLGHSNTEQTLNTYSHLLPMSEDSIIRAIEHDNTL